MKKSYIAILALLAVFPVLGCSGTDNTSDNVETTGANVPAQPQTALTLVNVTLIPESYGGYSASGVAIANKDLKYAQIDAQFFDVDGALVYSSLTNTPNIKAGTTWKYKIIGPIDSNIVVSTCNVTEGTCY
jgi:hypothetical protein